MQAVADIKKQLFKFWFVRALVGGFFLCRGFLRMVVGDQYKGISDLCWVCRVSRVGRLKGIAFRAIMDFVAPYRHGENPLMAAFLKSADSEACKNNFLSKDSNWKLLYRDYLVLKAPLENEKGVLVLEYTTKFDLFVALFDFQRIIRDYYIVLEPCWAGYCDPSILMFLSNQSDVIVQCPEESDFDFISNLKSNLIPVKLGSSDWIDADLFAPRQAQEKKEFDLIMVANWARHKNHRHLFEALSRLKHRTISVLLVGIDWGGRTDQDIRVEMAQYDLGHVHVEIKKNISAREVSECLERSKVFLLLSEKEGSNRAIVEALFCDIPAILYENFVGGAKGKINDQTGVLSSFENLHDKIKYMLDNYQRFTPRSWALGHTGSRNAARILNDLLKDVARSRGEQWTIDIVEKVNNPNFSYKRKDAIPTGQQVATIARSYFRLPISQMPSD